MTSRLAFLIIYAGCAVPDDLAAVEQNAIATNAIATNAIATNAIATNAIATNAIATNGILSGAVTDKEIRRALHDPNARVFMKYLVSCALDAGQEVTWTSADRSTSETWSGALGLCPAWMSRAPDAACKQRVSACILARNNAFALSVKFSMRGSTPSGALRLSRVVPPHEYPRGSDTPAASTIACTQRTSGLRDCGWSLAAVGRCTPGTSTTVAEGSVPGCNGGAQLGTPSTVDTMLRVCEGITACDGADALASNDTACNAPAPAAQFTCPASGIYAVLHAPHDSRDSLANSEGVIAATSSYPSPELRVFRWREGAFYGDLFDRHNLNPAKPQVWVDANYVVQGVAESDAFRGVVYPHMYACASDNWNWPHALFEYRVCAGSDPKAPFTRNCAASYVGLCSQVCRTSDAGAAGDFDFGDCVGGDELWRLPSTTVLSDPCDMVPNGTCAHVPVPDLDQ